MQRITLTIITQLYSFFNFAFNPLSLVFDKIIKNMTQANQEALPIESLGFTEEEIAELSDTWTGQGFLNEVPNYPSSSSATPPIVMAMGKLKSYWTQLPDPLDDRIIEIMETI